MLKNEEQSENRVMKTETRITEEEEEEQNTTRIVKEQSEMTKLLKYWRWSKIGGKIVENKGN